MTGRTGRLYGFDNPCPKCGVLIGDHRWNGDCPQKPEDKDALIERLQKELKEVRAKTIEECASVAERFARITYSANARSGAIEVAKAIRSIDGGGK